MADNEEVVINVSDLPVTITVTINVTGSEEPPPPANIDPVANFTFNTVDRIVKFTSTASDPDGSIVGYDWDFGDGSPHRLSASPTHVYPSGMAASYDVTLVVTDNRGAKASITRTVSIAPQSFITEQLLRNVKEEIARNPGGIHARHFADMLVSGKPNGGGFRTSETRLNFADPAYTAAPAWVPNETIQFSAPGTSFPTTFGNDAYGQNFTDDAVAVLTLAIRSRLDTDPATADACAVAAIRCLFVWVDKLDYVDSQWDNNLATGKLWWAWGWQQLGPALSILWNHKTFTAAMKQQIADWCWVVGLDKSATATSVGIVYDPDDGHWIRSRDHNSSDPFEVSPAPGVTGEGNLLAEIGGSNHTLTYWMARLHSAMAIGGTRGLSIVDAVVSDFRALVRSMIYFTGDAHHLLGTGWPVSPQPPGYPKPSAYDSAVEIAQYWFENVNLWTPVDGLSQELGRDHGHQRMSNYALYCLCETLTVGGFGDFFSNEDSGVPNWIERLVATEELDNGTHREVIEVGRAAPYNGDIDGALSDSSWTPTGKYTGVSWVEKNIGTNGGVTGGFVDRPSTYTVGGTSADRGTHLADYFLRFQRGLDMPNTQYLASILSGTGEQTPTNAAGVGIIRAGNQFTWEALLFSPIP